MFETIARQDKILCKSIVLLVYKVIQDLKVHNEIANQTALQTTND